MIFWAQEDLSRNAARSDTGPADPPRAGEGSRARASPTPAWKQPPQPRHISPQHPPSCTTASRPAARPAAGHRQRGRAAPTPELNQRSV